MMSSDFEIFLTATINFVSLGALVTLSPLFDYNNSCHEAVTSHPKAEFLFLDFNVHHKTWLRSFHADGEMDDAFHVFYL